MKRILVIASLIIAVIACQKELSIDNPDQTDPIDSSLYECKLLKIVQGLDGATDTVYFVETDNQGRISKIIDSEANLPYQATYDAIDRITNIRTRGVFDSDVDYVYDANGRLVSISYAGGVYGGRSYVFEYSTGKNPVRARWTFSATGFPDYTGTEYYLYDTKGNLVTINDTSEQGNVYRTEYVYSSEPNIIPKSLLQYRFGSNMLLFNELALYFSKNMMSERKTFHIGKTTDYARFRYELNDKEQIAVIEQEWVDPDSLEVTTLYTMRFFWECK